MVKKINIGKAFKNLGRTIKSTANTAINEVKKIEQIKQIKQPLVSAGETTLSGLKTAGQTTLSGLKTVGQTTLSGLKTAEQVGVKLETGISKELPKGLLQATDKVFEGLYTITPDTTVLDMGATMNETINDQPDMTFVILVGLAVGAYLLL